MAGALAILGLGLAGGTALAQEQDQETDTVTIQADRDAWVASGRADSNFGGDSRLYVGFRPDYGAVRTLIHFDFDDLEDDEVVTDGELKLYLRDAGPGSDPSRDIVIYRVTDDWNEGGVTWNNFPSNAGDRLASVGIGRSGGWYTWDIGRLVRNWYQEEWDNEGVYVQGFEGDGSFRAFDSSEGSNEPELELEVVIDKTPPTATVKPLPPFVNQRLIQLVWDEGVDPEPGTGVELYQLFGRRDNEPWLHIAETEETTVPFSPDQEGRQYSFRVDAVDYAGNVEPEGPAEATTLVDWSAPFTEMQPLPEFSRHEVLLRWTTQELPSGPGLQASGIERFDLQFRGRDGDWANLATDLTQSSYTLENPVHGALYEFRVRGVDRAGNFEEFGPPEASTVIDRLPPRTWFTPVSGVDNPEFQVRWHSLDPVSGVTTVDVQFRVDNGPWEDWMTRTTDRTKLFSGELGHTYHFRARARDVAGNEAPYPNRPQLTVLAIDGERLTERVFLPYTAGATDPGQPPR